MYISVYLHFNFFHICSPDATVLWEWGRAVSNWWGWGCRCVSAASCVLSQAPPAPWWWEWCGRTFIPSLTSTPTQHEAQGGQERWQEGAIRVRHRWERSCSSKSHHSCHSKMLCHFQVGGLFIYSMLYGTWSWFYMAVYNFSGQKNTYRYDSLMLRVLFLWWCALMIV